MTFWEAFFRTLRWRPRQALAGLYWHLTRRKVRARNRLRFGAQQAPFAYEYWIQSFEDNPALAERVPSIVQDWRWRPKFSVLILAHPGTSPDQIEASIASVKGQYYDEWMMIGAPAHDDTTARQMQVESAREIEEAIASATGDFIVPLPAGHLLSPSALFLFAKSLQSDPQPAILYGDEDEIDKRGRRVNPWFKPQWDEDMFLAQDYVSSACAIDSRLARGAKLSDCASNEAGLYALVLQAGRSASERILHIPHILCHVTSSSQKPNQAARVAVVDRHLGTVGGGAAPGPFETVIARWPLPDDVPGVSIIIPTRDKVELLRACVESVLQKTRYPRFELIVVDNGSSDAGALAYLSEISTREQVRVLTYHHPYNYSAINNFASEHANYPYLCLLNNDTEVLTEEWLTEMMRYAVRADVGAVGAKLLYEDGSIQHAGVVVGICDAAGHAHRFERSDSPGYFAQAHIARRVSAVTAACLVVSKEKFDAVGRLDAERLAIAYNDVDLCLKLKQAGWHNIYVPHAVLLHHESKSRGLDMSRKHIDRYMRELGVLQQRWATKDFCDGSHNENLDRSSETYILKL